MNLLLHLYFKSVAVPAFRYVLYPKVLCATHGYQNEGEKCVMSSDGSMFKREIGHR